MHVSTRIATKTTACAQYIAEYVPLVGPVRVILEGSRAEARRAAATQLGYRNIRSAYSYTSETENGNDAEFFVRRVDASKEDFACVRIFRSGL